MRPSRTPPRRRSALPLAVVTLVAAAACDRAPPPGAEKAEKADAAGPAHGKGVPVVPEVLAPTPSAPASAEVPPAPSAPPPHAGPYLVVTDSSAGVYSETSLSPKKKIGYVRSGGKVPVLDGTTPHASCSRGWYRLRDGGFICSNAGTTKVASPEARFTTRAPDPEAVLPYRYARNAKNGTPLYRSVPTPEQMREYEPYLNEKAAPAPSAQVKASVAPSAQVKASVAPSAQVNAPVPAAASSAVAPSLATSAGRSAAPSSATAIAPAAPTAAPAPAPAAVEPIGGPDAGADDSPWWQRQDADKRLHEVKLEALSAEADGILSSRMVKGFYVAVDREFIWHGRPWYKTTKGLVAPADRFWATAGSEFRGVELTGDKARLPLGFAIGASKGRPTYRLEGESTLKPAATIPHRSTVLLTGAERTIARKSYVELEDGTFMHAAHLRIAKPGPPPPDLGENERWVDVNLTSQTLVAYEGSRPVYATLISSGKESKVKEKDHRTPLGEWRIREKHVTATMDGDGSAAGDLPYSIEDVPYVMYYHRAYALHGAFWHSNYGSQMSHGCVNLAPLDAKWVFRFLGPHLPEGWHGVWATDEHPGSRVVVHE